MQGPWSIMTELFFQRATGVKMKDPADPDAVAELKIGLPRSAQRRMTLMGMMMHRMLEGRELKGVPAVVYLTAFGESGTMEKYLASYPTPSPMCFQASIHPSGVEQSLILRQQPIPLFLPLAGQDALYQVLKMAPTLAVGTIIAAAEERGTWLVEKHLSSRTTYAWALTVTDSRSADGSLILESEYRVDACTGSFSDLAPALAQRNPWECTRSELGRIRLQWR